MKIHELKINQVYYDKLLSGSKTAELRYNDRNYQVGDIIYFNEIIQEDGTYKKPKYRYSADKIHIFYITDVLKDDKYLQPNFVMLSISRLYVRPGLCVFDNNHIQFDPVYKLNNVNHRELNMWVNNLMESTY